VADTVFANNMSVCHKNSAGKAVGFPDVCLSPPPPPAGPVPIPYPNTAMASDLSNGSKTVKADGAEIALEDSSYIATSTGDEAGTQGGNVVTHKTKGKAYFMAWSFDVQVEGKGVGRNGDPMSMNCASQPYGGVHPAFIDLVVKAEEGDTLCDEPYDREKNDHNSPTTKQRELIKGKKCWECIATGVKRPRNATIADHQPPLVLTYYSGGCANEAKMKKAATTTNTDPNKGPCILPHCEFHSEKQRRAMARFSRFVNRFVQQF
jgi:hypothetical protein